MNTTTTVNVFIEEINAALLPIKDNKNYKQNRDLDSVIEGAIVPLLKDLPLFFTNTRELRYKTTVDENILINNYMFSIVRDIEYDKRSSITGRILKINAITIESALQIDFNIPLSEYFKLFKINFLNKRIESFDLNIQELKSDLDKFEKFKKEDEELLKIITQ